MPQLLTSLSDFPAGLRGGAVSVGNFDGVHVGHSRLIQQLVATARELSGPAIVLTFAPPPAALLYPERQLAAPLTTIARRAELLFELGVDALLAYPTDMELLSLSAQEFFQQKILGILHARGMVEGPNFRFGRDRDGDVDRLQTLCVQSGVLFQVAQPSADAQGMISSTRIRQLLVDGQVAAANAWLTQAYQLQGIVVSGAQRGRQLGFPTANLTEVGSLIPAAGVYAGQVTLSDESHDTVDDHARVAGDQLAHSDRGQRQSYWAAVNIGPNPTFEEAGTKVEVHLIGYTGGALYGRTMAVSLLRQIRAVRKFDSIDALRAQISRDVAQCIPNEATAHVPPQVR